MKKSILAALITVAMVITILPVSASANDVYVMEVDFDGEGAGSPEQYSNFAEGWNAAVGVNNSVNTTVKLLANWTATVSGDTTSFGEGAGFEGGSILVPSGKCINLDLNGKTIDRHLSDVKDAGCAIRIRGGHLTLNDSGTTGTIKGGADSAAGGVVINSGCFTMNGGTITENKGSSDCGSGIFIDVDGCFIMTGGRITGNTCGAGVYIYYETPTEALHISGAPVITDNYPDSTSSSNVKNVYLPDDKMIKVVGNINSTAIIGITTETQPSSSFAIIDPNDYTISGTIKSDVSNSVITCEENGAYYINHSYTVQFNPTGGSIIASTTDNLSGSKITEPSVPTRNGYVFDGWYKETGLVNKWNFATEIVSTDITLYAKWLKQLTITGNLVDNKTYDGTTNAIVHLGTVTGITTGDDVIVKVTGSFDTKEAGTDKTVTLTYTLSGADASKYVTPVAEIIKADINPVFTKYDFISGENSKVDVSNTDGAKFTIEADNSKFKNVTMDGSTISADKYTVTKGSTIIVLRPEYLSTLSKGEHTLLVNFTDGSATTKFTLSESSDIKAADIKATDIKAGDNKSFAGYPLFVIVVLSFGSILLIKRHRYKSI